MLRQVTVVFHFVLMFFEDASEVQHYSLFIFQRIWYVSIEEVRIDVR